MRRRAALLPTTPDGSQHECHYRNRIGTGMFHVLTNALAVARFQNKLAGQKVVKVRVLKQHFMVMEVEGE